MSDPLLLTIDGAIARVTLNRPDAFNAMNAPLRDAFRDAISRIHANKNVRVVILSGEGRGFCAGTDLTEGLPGPVSLLIDREYRPILGAIADSPHIWIAQVHGSAAGIGAAAISGFSRTSKPTFLRLNPSVSPMAAIPKTEPAGTSKSEVQAHQVPFGSAFPASDDVGAEPIPLS